MEDINIFMGKLEHKNLKTTIDSQRICTEYFNTTDKLDFETQDLIKYIGKEILTGNEEWFYCIEKKTYYYNQFNKITVNNNSAQMMCNYFTFSTEEKPSWGKFCNGKNQEIHFNYDNGEKGVENFKGWLREKYNSSNPIEVYFTMQYPNILCKRFYYNSNPRFKGVHYSIKSKSGGLDPILDFKEMIDVENNNDIYKRDIVINEKDY